MKRLEKSNDRLLVVDDEKEPSIFDYLGFESHDCRNYAAVITGDEEKLLLICYKCGRGLVEYSSSIHFSVHLKLLPTS